MIVLADVLAICLRTVAPQHVSDSKAPYKWLSGGVAFVDTIPRNPSGKLLRRLLRDEAKKLGLKMADKGSTVTVGSRL